MDENADISGRIQAYLDGELQPEDRAAFEKELADNPALREELQLQEEAHLLLKHGVREQSRREVSDLFAEEFPETRKPSAFPWFRVAAAVLVLAVSIPLGIFFFKGPSHSDLFDSYFQPMEDRITTMGGPSAVDVFQKGLSAYNQEEFTSAIEWFDKVPSGDSLYDYALLYSGNARLAQGKAKKALEEFMRIKEEKGGFPAEARTWYLALCYLKLEQADSARVLLDQIIGTEGPAYQKGKARELREQLD